MDFGSGNAATTIHTGTYSQNGLNMTPLDTGLAGTSGPNHWDWMRNTGGANSSNWYAIIHSGNNAEELRFDFAGEAFDLLRINIMNLVGPSYLTSSNGGSYDLTNTGILDFSQIAGFSNITWFKLAVPLGYGVCGTGPCPD